MDRGVGLWRAVIGKPDDGLGVGNCLGLSLDLSRAEDGEVDGWKGFFDFCQGAVRC